MHIVLLSGGSGKRLWPLSNDIKSKQFLKVFKENNEYKSMLERVYGQIRRNLDAKITIATNATQVGFIQNQLDDKVSICVEPTRRDTFPAIALVSAYLKDKLGVDENECICVCPVDPYVDDSYFKNLIKLQDCLNKTNANLVLMGISPTYPSEKYGYIIPKTADEVSDVLEFKEKPNEKEAKEYIARNALWNAGVFAFKLKHLLEKAHAMIDFVDYEDLFNKFETLEKISFDYAVVEKEKNIKIVRYNGEWRDVGTWNTLTEVMPQKQKGNVICDDKTKNTSVINDLDIPLLTMGVEDLIVVAGADGILVSTKNRIGAIKSYVEKINSEPRVGEQSWGEFKLLQKTNQAKTTYLTIKQGATFSKTSETATNIVVLAGNGKISFDNQTKTLIKADMVKILKNMEYIIKAQTELVILEVQIND